MIQSNLTSQSQKRISRDKMLKIIQIFLAFAITATFVASKSLNKENLEIKYTNWSEWSECYGKCNTQGVQNRTRKCYSEDTISGAILSRKCLDYSFESRNCEPECSFWEKALTTAAESIDYASKKVEEGVDFTGEKLSDGVDKMNEGVDKTKEIASEGYDQAANFMDGVFGGVKGLFKEKNSTDDFGFSFKLF